jgi:hypothetical protein
LKRIDNPKEKVPFLFEETTIVPSRKVVLEEDLEHIPKEKIVQFETEQTKFYKKIGIQQPLQSHLKVCAGKVEGRKRPCAVKLVYTNDFNPFIDSGTLKLSYSYYFTQNGVMKDVPPEEYAEQTENKQQNKQRNKQQNKFC